MSTSFSSSSRVDLEKFRIPLEEIINATQNFSPETKIGEAGSGVVYKGVLSERWGNRTAAFKRHDPYNHLGEDGFPNELKLMPILNHENITSSIGYCDEGNEMIIVSEYAINGSLADYIGDDDKSRHITWAQRLKICLGVAKGIKYLHSGLGDGTKVIHRFINSLSILLYDNLEAKISDFYLSVILPRNQPQVYTFAWGTDFHMDPIYRESGILKEVTDLYSFGVVVFEMLSGMFAQQERSIGDVKPQTLMNLVRRYYDAGIDNLIDPHIRDQIDRRSLHMVTEMSYKCISFSLADRPTIDAVIKTIEKALDIHNHGAASIITIQSHQHHNPEEFVIPMEEIKRATQNFSEKYLIGIGDFGSVYRGQLSKRWQNQIAAIKRLDPDGLQGTEEFLNELELMSSFHHDNIIPFIGYCDEGDEMIIVTKYASNRSLDDHLTNPDKRSLLTWTRRLNICIGVARGLKYLHSGLGERGRVIHNDAKSGNILLDDNLEAKICDFGLSKLIPRNQPHVYELAWVTSHYTDPIYQETGYLKTDADVYTFGVLLFEMLSGMLANDTQTFGDVEPQTLMQLVRRYYDEGLDILLDPSIRDQVRRESLHAFTELAYECVSFNLKARPSMNRIVKRLEAVLDFENHGATSATTMRGFGIQNLEDFLIPIEEIKKAVGDFNKKSLAGNGGFGFVYKGQLSQRWQNRTVAIKRLSREAAQGNNEFLHELRLNFRCNHENIIPFVGYCDQDDEKIIVTEYAINGSLDCYLEKPEKRGHLTWGKRLQICLGAAKGLDYLHSGRGEDNRVIHRDIKSGNILLDENLVAKICDFGMSKLDATNQPHTGVYTKTAGTNYYLDPIYQESGKLRVESDVYSLGVVMFEMLSGLMAYRRKHFGDGNPQYLINLVRRYYARGEDMLMDPLIRDQTDTQSFLTFQELAYGCINMNYKERPTTATIIDTIEEALDYQERYLQRQQLQGLSIGSNSKGNDQQDKK